MQSRNSNSAPAGRTTDFFQSGRLPHKCGVPQPTGTPHLCGSEELCRARTPATGFTLIELVAVLGLLALGAAMLAPALARTQPNSRAFECLHNVQQLAVAASMYSSDSADSYPPNRDGGNSGKDLGDASWAGGWEDFSSNNPDNTNTDLLINHVDYPHAAYVGQYLKTAQPFRCPADKSQSTINGRKMDRVRSYSLQNWIAGDPAPGVPGSRTWTSPSRYGSYYQKVTDVKGPSLTFMFLDEREDSINDGCLWTDPDTLYQIVDYPASYHDNAGVFSFADGHAEIHKWLDPRTMPVLHPGQLLSSVVNLPGDLDVFWLAQHAVGLSTYP
jgi:prepilin-type processing-associated H-X9-DG protein